MKLTPKLAQAIADRYAAAHASACESEFDRALASVIRRNGGVCGVLTEDARRDLIMTLGDNRRAANAYKLWKRHGGDTSRPWTRAYGEWLTSQVRATTALDLASAAE
jgi:hypothetical protein